MPSLVQLSFERPDTLYKILNTLLYNILPPELDSPVLASPSGIHAKLSSDHSDKKSLEPWFMPNADPSVMPD